jgi:hypothetical protein
MSNQETATGLIREATVAGRSTPAAFGGGAVIGALGGLIGLGGAEFRLPLLIGAFQFGALQAVILDKAMSLVVVASALPFRAATVPFAAVAAHWTIIVRAPRAAVIAVRGLSDLTHCKIRSQAVLLVSRASRRDRSRD